MTKTQTYSNNLYAHFEANAEEQVVNGQVVSVWNGSMSATCRRLNIPKGSERRVIGPLEDMGCIQIVARGVSIHPSMVAVIKPPTEEMWEQYGAKNSLTARMSHATLVKRVEEIEQRLGGANLAEALLNLDRRLTAVEATIAEKH